MYFPLLIVFLQPFYLLLGLNEQYLCLQFLFFVMFLLVFFSEETRQYTYTHWKRERIKVKEIFKKAQCKNHKQREREKEEMTKKQMNEHHYVEK